MRRVLSVNVARPGLVVHAGRRYSTAINKRPVEGPLRLTTDGFTGDRVADSENHGGPDKAACCYPHEHYPGWADRLGIDLPIPSFGENLTTEGLLEAEVCIGDTYRIGSALIQVSQPRQPCWKLANKLNCRQLPAWITERAFTGFYVRVLEEGEIQAGEEVHLIDRPHPQYSVELVARQILTPHKDPDVLKRLADLPALSLGWRKRAAGLIN